MTFTTSETAFNIPLSEPVITGNEWKYIKECIDTGWVSSVGRYVDRFEESVSHYVGCKYAVATVNGTAALHISLLVCGVQPGDEVIVPTLTFISPVNTAKYCGAEPVFMDCDPATLCLDIDKLQSFLENNTNQKPDGYTYNNLTGKRIKAVIPVHVFGHPTDMDDLIRICDPRNIDIIEDATESLGSKYKGAKTGRLGKIGCFSFNGNKIITTGGGGMIVTDDPKLAEKARHLTTQAKCDPFEYDHDEIGYNYRLTNLQAAMGVAQMEKLDEVISVKRHNAFLYRDLLSKLEDVEFIWEALWAQSNFWFYTIRVQNRHKNPLLKYLLSKNIQVRPVWKLVHSLPMYKDCQIYSIDSAELVYERCLNLPCSIRIKNEEIEFVVKNISDYFN